VRIDWAECADSSTEPLDPFACLRFRKGHASCRHRCTILPRDRGGYRSISGRIVQRPYSLRFVFPYSLISLVAQSQTVVPTHMACPDICQSPHSGARYRPYKSTRLYRRPTPSLRQHVVTSICQGAYIFICLHGSYLLDRSQVWAALAKAVGARPRRTYSGSVCVCVLQNGNT
jgi:hypothetical protein